MALEGLSQYLEPVDRLRVLVLVDDYSGMDARFLAQHGVSYLVEVEKAGRRTRILFDTGSSGEVVLRNMEALGVDPSTVDYVVISHSHSDHTGGLLEVLRRAGRRLIVVASPGIFKDVYSTRSRLRYTGAPWRRKEAEEAGALLALSSDPVPLFVGVITTGEIPYSDRLDFDRVDFGFVRFENGRLVKDFAEEEIGLAVYTKRGLFVIGGCSHPGIGGIALRASKLFGVNEIYAVMGGFHLINADDARIESTVRFLRELGVRKVFTGHCTGIRAEAKILKAFREGFGKLYPGFEVVVE